MKSLFMLGCCLVLLSAKASGQAVSINEFSARYGFPAPVSSEESLVFRSSYTEMRFKADSRMMHYNGVLVWLCAGAASDRKEWNVAKADAEKVLAPLLRAKDYTAKVKRPGLVLIDPGHGGTQTGARPKSGMIEKQLTLDIAGRLRDELVAKGIRCVLTRDRDVELSLADRTRQISALGADLFISIHMNSAANTEAKGFETYIVPAEGYQSTSGGEGSTARVVGNRNDELNCILAYLIQRDALKATGADDRGVKRARFVVLSGAACPAVLVECGFLSNTTEFGLLQTSKYRGAVAHGLAKGVEHYMSLWGKQ